MKRNILEEVPFGSEVIDSIYEINTVSPDNLYIKLKGVPGIFHYKSMDQNDIELTLDDALNGTWYLLGETDD